MSDANYAALGIPSGAAVETPSATIPVGKVDTSERLRHTISFFDAANPAIKRRPRGTIGCEIWVKIDGPPPGNEQDCTFLALDTATPPNTHPPTPAKWRTIYSAGSSATAPAPPLAKPFQPQSPHKTLATNCTNNTNQFGRG